MQNYCFFFNRPNNLEKKCSPGCIFSEFGGLSALFQVEKQAAMARPLLLQSDMIADVTTYMSSDAGVDIIDYMSSDAGVDITAYNE